jgi:hypothetical protein
LEVATKDLHERRLAGPVLPHEGVHLAGLDRQVDAVKHLNSGERLRYPIHLEISRSDGLPNHEGLLLLSRPSL